MPDDRVLRPGQYQQQPGQRRRAEDRVPETRRAKHSDEDVVEAMRVLLDEVRSAEPTQRFSVPPPEAAAALRERDARELAAIVPAWKHWVRTGVVVAAIAGAGAAVVGAVIAAQGWVSHTVTVEVAPVREAVTRLEADVRAIRRAVEAAP